MFLPDRPDLDLIAWKPDQCSTYWTIWCIELKRKFWMVDYTSFTQTCFYNMILATFACYLAHSIFAAMVQPQDHAVTNNHANDKCLQTNLWKWKSLGFLYRQESLLCELCEAVELVFQKTAAASLSAFFDTFNPLMFTLTPKDGSQRGTWSLLLNMNCSYYY